MRRPFLGRRRMPSAATTAVGGLAEEVQRGVDSRAVVVSLVVGVKMAAEAVEARQARW